MFRPSLGHLQALKEHCALWDPKCSQDVSIWDPTMRFYKKNLCDLGSVFFEGLKMNQ